MRQEISTIKRQVLEQIKDAQLEMLRFVIDLGGTTRAELAAHMNVTKRTVDAWLLPKHSTGRRNMSQSQSERLQQFTTEAILRGHYSVVEGSKSKFPTRLQMVEFPAIYRTNEDGLKSQFSFSPDGLEVEHLSVLNGDDWLFITPHLSLQHMQSFLWGERAWRNPLHYEQLSFCRYSVYYFSLTRMRPAWCFAEKGLTLFGGGCLLGSMNIDSEDPYIAIGPTGIRYAQQFEVVTAENVSHE